MVEKLHHSQFEQGGNAPRLKAGVHIRDSWKAQHEMASQWETVNKLQELVVKVKNEEEKEHKSLDNNSKLRVLGERLAARVNEEEKKLRAAMQGLQELYDWPRGGQRGAHLEDADVNLMNELEHELNK